GTCVHVIPPIAESAANTTSRDFSLPCSLTQSQRTKFSISLRSSKRRRSRDGSDTLFLITRGGHSCPSMCGLVRVRTIESRLRYVFQCSFLEFPTTKARTLNENT